MPFAEVTSCASNMPKISEKRVKETRSTGGGGGGYKASDMYVHTRGVAAVSSHTHGNGIVVRRDFDK